MKTDLARQPLVPAFLTLAALAVSAVWGAGLLAPAGTGFSAPFASLRGIPITPGFAPAAESVTLPAPNELIARFQQLHPGWARAIACSLILFTGMCIGRMTLRHNLYKVGTCLAIPLYAVIACGTALDGNYLQTFAASALMALSTKNFARSFCNGYGFDRIFRASLYLGLLLLTAPAALPLVLLLPLALLLFRRTVREAVVALFGLLLPLLVYAYIDWGLGGTFTAPLLRFLSAFLSGELFGMPVRMPMPMLIASGSLVLLTILTLTLFFSDLYATGTKARFILIFNGCSFVLTILLLLGPAATRGTLALLAVPVSILLPFLFVRIRSALSDPLYLLLLVSAFAGILIL